MLTSIQPIHNTVETRGNHFYKSADKTFVIFD